MDAFQSWLDNVDPNQIGLGGLVTVMIVSILRGWVVPRSVHMDRMSDKDGQITALSKERDDWKEAFQKSEETKTELTHQNSDLISGADTTTRLMDSLRAQIDRNGTMPQRQIEG